jgi:hypothetical protein
VNLAVISPAYYPTDEPIKLLRDSCAIHHLPFYPFGGGRQWRGDMVAHFEGALEAIGNLPSIVDLVMFTDAGDAFVMAGADEIVEKWQAYGCPVLMSAEQSLYPWGLEEKWAASEATRPPAPPPWQYPNGGGWIGRREQLESLLKFALDSEGEEAQSKWISAYCSGRYNFQLDSSCLIFQTMSGDNGALEWEHHRLVNKYTGSRPVVVHFNGKLGGIQDFYRNAYGR